MKENKYIEIKEDLKNIIDAAFYDFDDYVTDCHESGVDVTEDVEDFVADAIIKAGYRKQSEGEWEWHTEQHGNPIDGMDEDFGYRCSNCKAWASEYGVDGDIYEEPPTNILHYCPNCGARMKGGTE